MNRYNVTRKDYIISFLVGLGISVIAGPITGSALLQTYSSAWWIFQFLFGVVSVFLSHLVVVLLFIPPLPQPEVPRRVNAFDDAIVKAGYNYFAISSKEIALWRSPTFMYYLTLNDVKHIIEYGIQHGGIEFSTDEHDNRVFQASGLQMVRRIAQGEIDPSFSALRLLIYTEDAYAEHETEILALIQMHAIARVHCIPIVRERLVRKLSNSDREKLKNLSKRLNQSILDEKPAMSRMSRLGDWMRRSTPDDVYSVPFPDFLLINMTVEEDEHLWWYERENPCDTKDRMPRELAREVYQLICKHVDQGTLWRNYTSTIGTTIPVGTPGDTDFFSLDFFKKWVEEIVPKNTKLLEWRKEEERVLKDELAKLGTVTAALDIGCGWGRHMEILVDGGVEDVQGIDTNWVMARRFQPMYEKHGKKVGFRLEDAQKTSFATDSFDLVVCMTNTFGNLGEDSVKRKVADEIKRVLKPGGRLIVSVYNDSEDALSIRRASYRDVDLHPFLLDDKRTILAKEGLRSEQFSSRALQGFFSGFARDQQIIRVNNLALILTATRK